LVLAKDKVTQCLTREHININNAY